MLAASAISIGWKRKSNCGTPKSNSAWNVERPIRKPPASEARRRRHAALPAAGARARALGEQDALADERDRGAADQHQVRRAPQRHVLAEQPVPDVVEREADQREAARGGHQHAAERRVPALEEPDRRRARLLLRDRHREEAGGEDAEQAEEDQVVGRVGERARVAALVDVQGDVPVHAEQRGDQRGRGDRGGQRDPRRAGRRRGPRTRPSARAAASCRRGGRGRARTGGWWRSARRRWRARPRRAAAPPAGSAWAKKVVIGLCITV